VLQRENSGGYHLDDTITYRIVCPNHQRD